MSIEDILSALDVSLAVGALLVVFLRVDKRLIDLLDQE